MAAAGTGGSCGRTRSTSRAWTSSWSATSAAPGPWRSARRRPPGAPTSAALAPGRTPGARGGRTGRSTRPSSSSRASSPAAPSAPSTAASTTPTTLQVAYSAAATPSSARHTHPDTARARLVAPESPRRTANAAPVGTSGGSRACVTACPTRSPPFCCLFWQIAGVDALLFWGLPVLRVRPRDISWMDRAAFGHSCESGPSPSRDSCDHLEPKCGNCWMQSCFGDSTKAES